jgi:WD40 repeat protein
MSAPRVFAIAALVCTILVLAHQPSAGQGNPKAKLKPGAPLVADPNDLPKFGAPFNGFALVQRPPSLKNVRSWSIETKRHRWVVDSVSVRPDGKKFATSGHDSIVRIWDAESGEFERALMGHEGRVSGLAWSPDGKYLASAGYYSTRVWDGATGMPVRVLRGKYGVSLVAWSPDGTRLLTGGGGSGQLALWDVAAGKQLVETEYGQPIGNIAFSPTGEHVAAAASRAGTYIADSEKLKTVHVFKEILDTDYSVAFSQDGKQLAAGSAKQTVIYSAESGAVIKKLASPGLALKWTPKGSLLVVNASHQIVPHSPSDLVPGKSLPGAAAVLSLTENGTRLVGLYGGSVSQWDLEQSTITKTTVVGEYTTIYAGPSTVVIVPDATPSLWDAATGKKVGVLDGHKGGIVAIAWAPSGKTVAVAAADKKVRIYEPTTAKLVRTLTAPAAVTAMTVSGDGRVAVSTANKKVTIWPANGEEPTQTLDGFSKPVPRLAMTRDGRFLATAIDKEIAIYSTETGKSTKTLEHPRQVYSIIWSTDSGRLVVGSSEDVTLTAYQASTWKLQPAYDKGPASLAAVTAYWSPDGNVLLGHRNSAIQQWNGKTGKVGIASGSPVGASSIAFWPNATTIVGGSVDRAARFWDSGSGRLRFTLISERDQTLAVNAEGHYRCPEAVEGEVVAVVMTDKVHESLPLKDFATKYGFRNVPGNVK